MPNHIDDTLIDAGHRRLIARVLIDAMKAARSGDAEARAWLRTDQAWSWLDYLGIMHRTPHNARRLARLCRKLR